jgi:hypothetical protein
MKRNPLKSLRYATRPQGFPAQIVPPREEKRPKRRKTRKRRSVRLRRVGILQTPPTLSQNPVHLHHTLLPLYLDPRRGNANQASTPQSSIMMSLEMNRR